MSVARRIPSRIGTQTVSHRISEAGSGSGSDAWIGPRMSASWGIIPRPSLPFKVFFGVNFLPLPSRTPPETIRRMSRQGRGKGYSDLGEHRLIARGRRDETVLSQIRVPFTT